MPLYVYVEEGSDVDITVVISMDITVVELYSIVSCYLVITNRHVYKYLYR